MDRESNAMEMCLFISLPVINFTISEYDSWFRVLADFLSFMTFYPGFLFDIAEILANRRDTGL